MDLRHVVWTVEDGKWVRATSQEFSCWPEAKAYTDTMDRSRKVHILPLELEETIKRDGFWDGYETCIYSY